jgi:DNA polymerase-3 subunit epsilon
MAADWLDRPWTVLDFESTGVDLENDRAVQAAVVRIHGGKVERAVSQVINPGIEIPQGAIDVHHITNERAQAEGVDPAKHLPWVAGVVEGAWANGECVIATNASFDVTLLDRELRRHFGRGLDLTNAAVVDPLVVDRACDPWRPGGRKLVDMAAHYRVKVTDAHDALGDCLTAARVVWRQARMTATEGPGKNGRPRRMNYAPLRELELPDLHRWQADRHADWAQSFQTHLRKTGKDPSAVIDTNWPIRPMVEVSTNA